MIRVNQQVNLDLLHEEIQTIPGMVTDGVLQYVIIINDLPPSPEVFISPFFGETINEEAILSVLRAHDPSKRSRKQEERDERARRAARMARIASTLPRTLKKARRAVRESDKGEEVQPLIEAIEALTEMVTFLYSERDK